MTKTIYLLNINDFAPELTKITYPLIQLYAKRIGATVEKITERKFPQYPVTYEKLQIYERAKLNGSDWNLYIDSDTLIHPECPDYTIYLPMGTVSFHASDNSVTRFRPTDEFMRDGRFLAPGNWFMIASRLCLDLWHPIPMTAEKAISNITPTVKELEHGIQAEHLIDDYALAYNISRYGLRFKSFIDINKELKIGEPLQHQYLMTIPEKIAFLKRQIVTWGIESYFPDETLPTAEEVKQWQQSING